MQKKRGAKEQLTKCAAVPKDVKLVFRVGKRHTRWVRDREGVVARAEWVVGLRRCIVLSFVIGSVRTAPTTVRHLCVSESAAIPKTP